MQFVKLSKFHKSFGHSSDAQIQTCTSILFLSRIFISTRNGDVGVQKHPTLPWDTAGEGGTGGDSERSKPF